MALDLSKLSMATAEMPKPARGREATPVPASILDAVKNTYALPEGQGGAFHVPNGEKDDNGKDKNVQLVVSQIRKAATQLGYGVSLKIFDPKAKTTEVRFRAKAKSERTRRTKAQILEDEWLAYFRTAELSELPERDAVDENNEPVYADDADYAAAEGAWTTYESEDGK